MKKGLTKRKLQALETRNKIIDCALELFEEKGFNNVSMDMIAEKSNTSIGSIYYYFSGKEEMAAQTTLLLDEKYDDFLEDLINNEAYKHLSPLEKLIEYYIFVQLRSTELKSLNFAYIHDLKNEDLKVLRLGKNRIIYKNYIRLLQLCRDEELLIDDISDEEIIRILTYGSRGLLVDWMIGNRGFDISSEARLLINTIFEGIRKKDV